MKSRILAALAITLFGTVAFWKAGAVEPTPPYSPTVVAKASHTNVLSDVGPLALFTPNNEHDYELLVYVTSPNVSAAGSLRVTISWVDEYMGHTLQVLVPSGNQDSSQIYGSTNGAFPIVLHTAANQAINYSLQYNDGQTNGPFDVFLTLVKE